VAIAEGVDPLTAIRMATLNTAEHYRMDDRGAVAPGRRGDLVVFSDLAAPRAEMVFVSGELVAQDGRMRVKQLRRLYDHFPKTVRIDPESLELEIRAAGSHARHARVIGVIPDQLITQHLTREVPVRDGLAVADPSRNLLKMAVVERHRGTGNVGLGFVEGVGLTRGAIASTVAHDHHNLVVIGADDVSMRTAALAVAEAGGGQAVAVGENVVALLPLPIAGLMSDWEIEHVRDSMRRLLDAAHRHGAQLRDPFMAMSFLALEVIPALKLTDKGLVDVERFEVVPLFV
jgi:adenine deaminase